MIDKVLKVTEGAITLKKNELFGIEKDESILFKDLSYIDIEVRHEYEKNIAEYAVLTVKRAGKPVQAYYTPVCRAEGIRISNILAAWKRCMRNFPEQYRGWISEDFSNPTVHRFVMFDPERMHSLKGELSRLVIDFSSHSAVKNGSDYKIIENPVWWWNGKGCRKSSVKQISEQCSELIEKRFKNKETDIMKKTETPKPIKQTKMPQERVFISTLGWIYVAGEKSRIHRNKCSDMIGFLGSDGNYYEIAEHLIKIYVKENYGGKNR